jgi:hypothetical protein
VSWRAIAAASAGTAHLARGVPCEDRCRAAVQESAGGEPVLWMFVSDGAGSVDCGGAGAELSVQTAADVVASQLSIKGFSPDRGLADACLSAARRAIIAAAQADARAPRDFACTLLGVVSTPRQTLALQIGDGGIVLDVGSGIELAITPMNGEYANTTCFVTDEDAPQRLIVRTYPQSARRAAAFSDGLQRLALDLASGTPHEPLFTRLFGVLAGAAAAEVDDLQQALLRFLDGAGVNDRTDDDKSLALAVLMN